MPAADCVLRMYCVIESRSGQSAAVSTEFQTPDFGRLLRYRQHARCGFEVPHFDMMAVQIHGCQQFAVRTEGERLDVAGLFDAARPLTSCGVPKGNSALGAEGEPTPVRTEGKRTRRPKLTFSDTAPFETAQDIPAVCFPDLRPADVVSRGDQRAVRAESYRCNAVTEALQFVHDSSGRDFPDAGSVYQKTLIVGFVEICRDPESVRAECHGSCPQVISGQWSADPPYLPSHDEIPHPGLIVFAARRQQPAVAADCQGADSSSVAAQKLQRLAGGRVQDCDFRATDCSDSAAVAVETQVFRKRTVDRPDHAAGVDLKKLQCFPL